jgi:PEP-CTERM motif-containing protein
VKSSVLPVLTLALTLLAARASQAAPINIVSLEYIHPTTQNVCEDTIPGQPPSTACAPIGVTLTGATNNPFLNDVDTKAIDLGHGSYYTFGNPDPGTNFMTQGDSLFARIVLSDGTILSNTILVPDLSVAGTVMFNFAAWGISIVTTGITGADRMSFGLPPTAFAPDGRLDYALKLDYTPVPEPASMMLLLTGLAASPVVWRRRKA